MTFDDPVGLEHARVAIVHDWLTVCAGAERVLQQMLAVFPRADLYCVCDFVAPSEREFLCGRIPRTTFIQQLPGARKHYRSYLPLMPLAIEQLDLSGYDIVLSSSHAVAKGVLTGPNQLHVSYVHSPMRYAWDMQHQYLRESGLDKGAKGWAARWMLHRMRLWDIRTANGVDVFLANSRFIARRIRKTYRREADVLYPPVQLERFRPAAAKEDFYFAVSRLVPYKRMDVIVKAFREMPDRRIRIAGVGPERPKLEELARGFRNIELLGSCSDSEVAHHLAHARALVFAAEEDFGIVPLESQACGTPVIAYGRGGALETIRGLGRCDEAPTGVFFEEQSPASIVTAIRRFEGHRDGFEASACRAQAERFSPGAFQEGLKRRVSAAWRDFAA
jgi:glycosyltransferase involved in cell wall biosynthesis